MSFRRSVIVLLLGLPLWLLAEEPTDTLALPADTLAEAAALPALPEALPVLPEDAFPVLLPDPEPDARIVHMLRADSLIRFRNDFIFTFSHLRLSVGRYVSLLAYRDTVMPLADTSRMQSYLDEAEAWIHMQDSCLSYLRYQDSLYCLQRPWLSLLDSAELRSPYLAYAESEQLAWHRGASVSGLDSLRLVQQRIVPAARQQLQLFAGRERLALAARDDPSMLDSYYAHATQYNLLPVVYGPGSIDSLMVRQQQALQDQAHCLQFVTQLSEVARNHKQVRGELLVGQPSMRSYTAFYKQFDLRWSPSADLLMFDTIRYVQESMIEITARYNRCIAGLQSIVDNAADLPDVSDDYQTLFATYNFAPRFRTTDDADRFLVLLQQVLDVQEHCLSYIAMRHRLQVSDRKVQAAVAPYALSRSYVDYMASLDLRWTPERTGQEAESVLQMHDLFLEAAARQQRVDDRADSVELRSAHCPDVAERYRELHNSHTYSPDIRTAYDMHIYEQTQQLVLQEQDACFRFIVLRDTLYERDLRTERVLSGSALLETYRAYLSRQDVAWQPAGTGMSVRRIFPVQDSLQVAVRMERALDVEADSTEAFAADYPYLQRTYRAHYSAMQRSVRIDSLADVQAYMGSLRAARHEQTVFRGFVETRRLVSVGHARVLDNISPMQDLYTAYHRYYESLNLDWQGASDLGFRLDTVCMVQQEFMQSIIRREQLFTGLDLVRQVASETRSQDVLKLYQPYYQTCYARVVRVTCLDDIQEYNAYLARMQREQQATLTFMQQRREVQERQADLDQSMRSYGYLRQACKTLYKTWEFDYTPSEDCCARLQQYADIQARIDHLLLSQDMKSVNQEFKSLKDARMVANRILQLTKLYTP